MFKACLITILLPLTLSAQSFNAKQGKVYLDKELKGTNRKNAVLEGTVAAVADGYLVMCSYADGKPMYAGTYADRKLQTRQGLARYYHENGALQAEGMVAANQKTGIWKYWHENKQLKDSGNYAGGYLEGIWKTWHKNGQLQSMVQFKPLLLTSVHSESGATKKVSGSQAEGSFQSFYEDGTPEATGLYNGGNPVGEWQWHHRNGRPSTKEFYNRQGKVDSIRCYDSTGAYQGEMCSIAKPAVLKGLGDFRTYLSEQFTWPDAAASVKKPTVVKIRFIVNTRGEMEQLRVESSERVLAETVHRFIKQLPQWYPAVSHNREISWTEQIELSYTPSEKRIEPFASAPIIEEDGI